MTGEIEDQDHALSLADERIAELDKAFAEPELQADSP